ncbi:tRNA lysidine(34) synthetase TilS [bacterium]|nr:tRNA lysidine(34) synthetase TilS [bacterium]
MIDRLKNFLDKYNLKGKTILVGFSGGFDSMCLLDMLFKIEAEYSLKVVAVHLNHNWRGEEALQEQEKCKAFCEDRRIEFYTKTASAGLKQTETVARALRYKFFDEAIDKYKADAFFTAHNKNDNAETILYRIVKGTGVNGLRGIAEHREIFYRPLLNISRAEIEKYCEDNELSPNFDSSNNDIKYKRNFIRHKVIPMLEKINPDVMEALSSLINLANEDYDVVEEYLDELRKIIFDKKSIITQEFLKLSQNVQRRIIYDWVLEHGLDYDYDVINRICMFINENKNSKSGMSKSLSAESWLFVNRDVVEIINKTKKLEDEVTVRVCGEYKIGDYIFELCGYTGEEIDEFPDDSMCYSYVDLSRVDIDFVLRTRRDGDIINPLGMAGTMKLKKYFTGKAIPKHIKENLILLCKENEILWVPGYGLSDKIIVDKNPTHVLILRKCE